MSRKTGYQAHLASPYWKSVRKLVKERGSVGADRLTGGWQSGEASGDGLPGYTYQPRGYEGGI